ncbi:MAG: DNA polymerase IV [Candidatus Zixiibacteriota bacterium]|nr:MAG: DNA polymerase IV [candidate division Zixibacteria bacterium]
MGAEQDMGGVDHKAIWAGHRVIIHLDMDAFFAAVEQMINPELRGRPVIVGGTPDSRGVVSTCSYEARNYGVHSAMPMKRAYELCPDAVFIDTSGGKYSFMSVEVVNILKQFTPYVESVSIDEAFMDISGVWKRYGSPKKTAESIKEKIKEKLCLTASVGIAPNRLVAKMASGSNKPDGLVIIQPHEVQQFLWVQPVEHLWGVGPKSTEALNKQGIKTIGELAKAPESKLRKMFGVLGPGLIKMARGEGVEDVRESHIDYDAKSMGHEHTFHRDTDDEDRVTGLLLYLCDKVSRRLRCSGCEARTVTLKVRKSNFKLLTRAMTLKNYIDDERAIFINAKKLLLKNRFLDRPIRLIGVSVSNLRKKESLYYDDLLERSNSENRRKELDKLLDRLRDRHGEESIFFAGTRLNRFDYP